MGIEVDIEASYKKMKKDGKFNEEKLVFKQVKPIIHLKNYRQHPFIKDILKNQWSALLLMLHGEMNICRIC